MSATHKGRLLPELARLLGMSTWRPEGSRACFVLEGGSVAYILDAEESEAGLLLALGAALLPHEIDNERVTARAAALAQKEGLRALYHEGRVYFAFNVPATATADVLHSALERCLACHTALRMMP